MAEYRTIREENGFREKAVSIFGTPEIADIALEGALWALTRETDFDSYTLITQLPNGPLYGYKTVKTLIFPSVVLYFSVETHKTMGELVVLWDIVEAIP